MTARPQDVALLPTPFGYIEPRHDLSGYEVFDEPGPRRAAIWNLHGMEAALASAQAREEELRAEVERLEIVGRLHEGTAGLAINAVAAAEARAERLEEALQFYANPEVYKPHPHGPAFDNRDLSFVAKNALSTNAATQTGERM